VKYIYFVLRGIMITMHTNDRAMADKVMTISCIYMCSSSETKHAGSILFFLINYSTCYKKNVDIMIK